MVIQARARDFVQSLHFLVCQFTISLNALLSMSFHVIDENMKFSKSTHLSCTLASRTLSILLTFPIFLAETERSCSYIDGSRIPCFSILVLTQRFEALNLLVGSLEESAMTKVLGKYSTRIQLLLHRFLIVLCKNDLT